MKQFCDDRGFPYEIARLTSAQYDELSPKLNMVRKNLFTNIEHVLTDHRGVGVILVGGVTGYLFWFFVVSPHSVAFVGYIIDSFLSFFFAFFLALGLHHVLYGWVLRGRGAFVETAYLEHGYCVSCGYALVDLPEEPDGCVVCPECSRAWKKERIGASSASG